METISGLLLLKLPPMVVYGCHFQSAFLTASKTFWSKILDYKESLVRDSPNPSLFVGNGVSLRNTPGDTKVCWEPWPFQGGLRISAFSLYFKMYRTLQHCLCHPLFHKCNIWLLIAQASPWRCCTDHFLSYRDGKKNERSWFHYAQAPSFEGALQ